MNRLRNGSIAVGAPGSPARVAAEAADNALQYGAFLLPVAPPKATCRHCGNEVWAVKFTTATGNEYYSLRDKFGNICKDGFWHIPVAVKP